MKFLYRIYWLLQISMFFTLNGYTQDDKYLLLTEPFVDRPVSMHQGQLQVNGAYQLSVTNGYFEANGNKTDLVDDGRAAIGHRYSLEAFYGILEFLELGVGIDFFKQVIRSKSIVYLDVFETLTVNELTEWNGFGDLLISSTIRLPFEIDIIDFGITGFYSLPVAEHNPDVPDHKYEAVESDGSWHEVDYRFNENNGIGVPLYGFGGALKIRLPKFALLARGSSMFPQKSGETYFWDSELINESFIYHKIGYPYLPQNNIQGSISTHFQPTEWLQIFAGGNYELRYGGWFDQNNQRYAFPVFSYYSLLFGMEIMVTPKMRIVEYAGFPINGQSSYADFYIYTGFSFNLITY